MDLLQHCRKRVSKLYSPQPRLCARPAQNQAKNNAVLMRTYPCRYRRNKSPSSSCCASSCHQSVRRSSFRLPSSLQVPFQLGPCPQWLASSQRLWEAFSRPRAWNKRLELKSEVGSGSWFWRDMSDEFVDG